MRNTISSEIWFYCFYLPAVDNLIIFSILISLCFNINPIPTFIVFSFITNNAALSIFSNLYSRGTFFVL